MCGPDITSEGRTHSVLLEEEPSAADSAALGRGGGPMMPPSKKAIGIGGGAGGVFESALALRKERTRVREKRRGTADGDCSGGDWGPCRGD